MVTFKQGADKAIPVKVDDTPTVDFTQAEDIVVVLFVGTLVQYQYSLNPRTLYGKLSIDNMDSSKLVVYAERENTVKFDAGALSAHVLATFANADFPDGYETKLWDISVGRVLAGRALGEEI